MVAEAGLALRKFSSLRTLFLRTRRFLNKCVNNLEYKFKRPVLWSYPQVIIADPTNICNLSCPLCATGVGSASHKKGIMGFDMFRGVMDKLGPYAYQLHLYNWGEPILNKNLCDLIRYAKQWPVKVYFSTNLNVLPERVADDLVTSGTDEITVAVDGITQETYSKYRVGGNLQAVLDNMRLLLRKKKEHGSATPKVIFRFMVMKHNVHEVETARQMAKEMGASFRTKTVRIDMFDFAQGRAKDKLPDRSEWLPEDPKYNRYRTMERSIKKHEKRVSGERVCQDLWKRTFISWDGSTHPCCNVYNVENFFATQWVDGWKQQVWNGEKYVMSRRIFSGQWPEEGKTICSWCVKSGNLNYVS
ncbi:MAG: radical SAM protein [Planctomycetes bacterium]|nr:radical SAM protein [Planctomycetota bacterium]